MYPLCKRTIFHVLNIFFLFHVSRLIKPHTSHVTRPLLLLLAATAVDELISILLSTGRTPSRSPSSLPSLEPSTVPSASPSTSTEISSLTELSDAIEDSQFGTVLAYLSGSAVSCRGSTLIIPSGNSWVFRLFGPGSISNCTFDVQQDAEFFLGNEIELSDVLFVISGRVSVQTLDLEADENVQFVQAANGGTLTIEDTSVSLSVCNDDMVSYQTEHCYRLYDQPFQSREAARRKCEVETDVSLGIFDPSSIRNVFSSVGLRTGLWTGARLDLSRELLVWKNGDTTRMLNSSWWSGIANTGGTFADLCAIIGVDGNIQAVPCTDSTAQYGALCSRPKHSLLSVENIMDATTSTNANWVGAVNTSFVLPNWASTTSSIGREVPTTCKNCSIAIVDASSQPPNEGVRQRRLASMGFDYLFGNVSPLLLLSPRDIGTEKGLGRLLQGTEDIIEGELDINRIAFDNEAYSGFVIVVEVDPASSGDPGASSSSHSISVDTVKGARTLTRDTNAPGWEFRAEFPGESLPSYVHFHTEQNDIFVVRMVVEIILADSRGLIRTFLLSSQEMRHFRDCEGGIVCSPTNDDEATCFKAAMVFSETGGGGSAHLFGLRRDLSFRLGARGCERLVHWTSPQNKSPPYHLQINMNTTHSMFPVRVTALSNLGAIPLSFAKPEASSTSWRAILTRDSFSELPNSFRFEPHLEGGEIGCIVGIDMLHYDETKWSFSSPDAFECKDVCSQFASSQCLMVSTGFVSTLEIDFVPVSDSLRSDPLCDQISRIEVANQGSNNTFSGEEMCTAPQASVDEIEKLGYVDLQEYLDDTLSRWRSVEIVLSSNKTNSTNSTGANFVSSSPYFSIQSRRRVGLVSLSDDDSSNTLANATIVAQPHSEVRLESLILSSVKADIDSGTVTFVRSILSGLSEVRGVNGHMEVASTRLVDEARISEEGIGSIAAFYSSIDQSATINNAKGSISTLSLELQALSSIGVVDGTNWNDVIEMLDAARIYLPVNETSHPSCANDFGGNDSGYISEPDATTLEECGNRCDWRQDQDNLECSGIYFNSLAFSLEERCSLCSSSNYALCSSRNCSIGATFYEAIEQAPFVAQKPKSACIVDTESDSIAVKTESLARCRTLCQYLQVCDAFTFDPIHSHVGDCMLLSRGDFDICTGNGPSVFGIEYKAIEEKAVVIGDFVRINGAMCLAANSEILYDLPVRFVTQCEATCTALVSCLSFIYLEDHGFCNFFSHRQMTACDPSSSDGDLYVFAGDNLPKFGLGSTASDTNSDHSEADGLVNLSCKLSDPYGALATIYAKDWFECRVSCDIKELCKAFTFDIVMGQRKCVLFGQESLGGLFSSTTCTQEVPVVPTWLGSHILTFVSSNDDVGSTMPGDPTNTGKIEATVATYSQCQALCTILRRRCDSIDFKDTDCVLGIGLEMEQIVRDAHSFSTPSSSPQDSYFKIGGVCIDRERRLDIGNALAEGSSLSSNICKLFCTVHPR